MLAEAGLSPEPDGEDLRCTIAVGGRTTTLRARRTPNWIVLETLPLAPTGDSAALHRALLRANRDVPLARFALSDSGEVTIRAELPTASLQAAEVRAVVDSFRTALSRLDALLGST
jgi:hypothetical protein